MSEEKKGFFSRLVEGLTKTRNNIMSGFDAIFSGFSNIDEDFYEELEEVLVMADLGIHTTENIIEELKRKVKEQHIKEPQACKQLLADTIKEQMRVDEEAYRFEHQTSVVLVIGVNGVGKTTTIGKLAGQYKKAGKKVVLAAADTFRAAAIEQLTEWAHRAGVDIIAGQEGSDPASVIYDAIAAAKARKADILLRDTAGRLHVDEDMMAELVEIKEAVNVFQTILVVDAMTGQDAVNVASTFDEKIGIDGVVLTKLDGDTRGGAALSIRAVTGKPILYAGMGEKLSDLEQFYPDRMASRILGMGDVLTMIEKAQENIDEEKAKELEQKMRKNEFDFDMYLESMSQMKKMGGLSSLMGMMPGLGMGAGKMPDIDTDEAEKNMKRIEAIIYSMTPKERQNPNLLNPSRKNRIAKGAGVDIAEVNRLVKQFEQMKKMMKQMPGMMGGKRGKRGMFKGLPF